MPEISPENSVPEKAPPRNSLPTSLHALGGFLLGRSAREGYLATLDQGTISLSNFIATILLARNASPTELGIYGVGFTALRLARSLQEGLVIQPVNVFGAGQDEQSFKGYVTSSTILQLLLALGIALAAAISGWWLTAIGNDVAGPTLFSLWFAFLFWQIQEHIRRILYTRGRVLNAVFNTLIANSVRLGIMLVWIRQSRLDGILSLDAIAWGSLAALLPGLWATRHFWTIKADPLLQTWRRNWDFGRWVLGSTLANWVAVEFYPVLTAGLISFAAAGAYRALQNLVAPIHLLLRAIDTFLTPRAARVFNLGGLGALQRTLSITYLAAGLPVLAILALALLFPQQILGLLYGETYLPYASGVSLMAIFYALWYAYSPLQIALKAARISRPIFLANLVAILSMFSLGILAIRLWGVNGTILGQALNALVVGVILWAAWLTLKRKTSA